MKELFNDFDSSFLDKEKILERRKEALINKHIKIIEDVWDKKRDDVLSSYFDSDVVIMKNVLDIIDEYETKKQKMIERFKKVVIVEVHTENEG